MVKVKKIKIKIGKNARTKTRPIQMPRPATMSRPKPSRSTRDSDSLKYARLLVDPCSAPVVPPPYDGAQGANNERQEARATGPYNTGTTVAVMAYHPTVGCFTYYESFGVGTGGTVLVGDRYAEAGANPYYIGLTAPFKTIALAGQTASGRATAGCLEMHWQGSEIYRGGTVLSGIVAGETLIPYIATAQGGGNQNLTFGLLSTMLAGSCRMPDNKCTLNYVPTIKDQQMQVINPVGPTTSTDDLQTFLVGINFMVIAASFSTVSGVTFVNPISFKMTAVLNFNYSFNAGFVGNAANVGPPSTFQKVIRWLQSKDPEWFVDTFTKTVALVGKTAASIAMIL